MAEGHATVHVRLDCPELGSSDVRVRSVVGREAISQPFSYDVDFVVADAGAELDAEKIVGAPASLVFERDGVELRTVHGMVTSFVDKLDAEHEHPSFSLRIVPRLQRSTLIETQEVFLNLTVPGVIQQKLSLVGLAAGDVDLRLRDKYPAREIVVQYCESDLAFVSRLCEHVGISYYFDHEAGADKIVFVDTNTGFASIDRLPTMPYNRTDRTGVFRLEAERHVFPASYAVLDYNYRAPHLELTSTHEHPAGHAGGVAEYGSHHATPAEGDRLARVRAEEYHARHRFFRGESDLVELFAGAIVKLTDHPRLADPHLLIVEVEHRLAQVVGVHGGDLEQSYANTFKAVDASFPYRPPRVTPRPRIQGVLTAITEPAPTGTSGKYSQIDDQGRYTVKFFFDTAAGDGRLRSSAPVRMAQPHAGQGYGMHFPLKPSVEVTVSFVNGDPDRPIISGAVPNPATATPVTGRESTFNRIKTEGGSMIEIKDH